MGVELHRAFVSSPEICKLVVNFPQFVLIVFESPVGRLPRNFISRSFLERFEQNGGISLAFTLVITLRAGNLSW